MDCTRLQRVSKKLRILIADAYEVVRKGIRSTLEQQTDWSIAGETSSGREALGLAAELRPDLLICDIYLPELSGLDLSERLRAEAPEIKVLILTGLRSDALWSRALEAGVRGVVLKSDPAAVIVEAVTAISQGGLYFTSGISGPLLDSFRRMNDPGFKPDPAMRGLTSREREIVQLVCEGATNKQIAQDLRLSIRTVETHRAHIMKKLKLNSLSDLVRWSIRNQLIEP